MNTFSIVFLLGLSRLVSYGRKPELPEDGLFPFIVYFESHWRGLCVGTLVARQVVLTAAVCVASPEGNLYTRPINVVTGTYYRHPMRGIRVQVVKILIPKLPDDIAARRYMLQKSVALLLLRTVVPDVLAEQPLRAIGVDYTGEDQLTSQECVTVGWHFYYSQDRIYPEQWWQLHRRARYQVLQLVDKEPECGELVRQFRNLSTGDVEDDAICFTDLNNAAQPCHGMYGAPLVCPHGRAVAVLAAPGAQWRDCDRQSILVHKLSSRQNRAFLECAESLLRPEYLFNWELISNKTT